MDIIDICASIRGTMDTGAGNAVVEHAERITPAIIARINQLVPSDQKCCRYHIEQAIAEAAGPHPLKPCPELQKLLANTRPEQYSQQQQVLANALPLQYSQQVLANARPLRLIEKCWIEYRKIIPPDASGVQLRECKRAFYAGAQAILWQMSGEFSSGNTDAENKELLERTVQELKDYGEDVARGRG